MLRVVDANATDEEVAAIVAALAVVLAPSDGEAATADTRSQWVDATRLAGRRTGVRRGEWRLSGRIGHRARA